MELDKVLRERQSIRKWKQKKVEKKLLIKLIDAARFAPNSCNRQTLKFLLIQKKNSIKLIANSLVGGIGFAHLASVIILVLADTRYYSIPIERHTPFLDGAAAIQNILLKAHELGLGAVWINWLVNSKKEKKIIEKLKIPFYFLPISVIALGYPAIKPIKSKRKKIEEFIKFEEFK